MTKDQKATRALGNRLAGLGIAVGYRHNDDGELEIRVCMAAAKKIAALLDRLSATAPELETIGTTTEIKPHAYSQGELAQAAVRLADADAKKIGENRWPDVVWRVEVSDAGAHLIVRWSSKHGGQFVARGLL